MTERKFYRTTITVTVLSEEPIPSELNLQELAYEMDEGEYVGFYPTTNIEELDGKQMAEALVKAGSEPEFFQLNDNGDDLDD